MDIVKIVKTVGGFVTSLGVGAVVGNVVKVTTPSKISAVNNVLTKIGGVIVGGLFSTMAANYVENKVDETVGTIQKITKKIQTDKTSNPEEGG